MSTMRLKRLQSDYEATRRLVHLHPGIDIEGVWGNPPDHYRFTLHVPSLAQEGETIKHVQDHRLEVTLPLGYPRDAPQCRMLTPVFHPNIAPHAVCIGDHWTAAESLSVMIQRVGEMLAFQSYNIKSPLNSQAAQWVEENSELLPLTSEEFYRDLEAAAEAPPDEAESRCANCQSAHADITCASGHTMCSDCAMICPQCGSVICLACGHTKCERCDSGQLGS